MGFRGLGVGGGEMAVWEGVLFGGFFFGWWRRGGERLGCGEK